MLEFQSYLDKMTLEEKASLMSGANFWNTKAVERLGIPSIMLTDGPHGLRKQGGRADHLGLNASLPATSFPTAATLASSWDVHLLQEVGEYIGREAASQGVSVLLGPGLNIIRNPLGGRTFEYYSEDPLLSGKLAASMVRGIQSNGIAACVKHYAANSQEHMRMSIDEVVDERSLREIYLEGFRIAVEEGGARTVMSSYNKVNGVYANENTHLLQDILYDEWQFDGVVVTDWGGNNNRVAGLCAGNQLEMPSTNGINDTEIVAAVKNGELDETVLDTRVDSLLRLVFETTKKLAKKPVVDYDAHHEKAIEAAKRSTVLLKNDTHLLPLKKGTRVAVIGDFARTPRYQGAGSSLVHPTRLDDAYTALRQSELEIIGFEPGFKRFGGKSARRVRRAVALAGQADVTVLFVGLDESSEAEGIDRSTMQLPANQLSLIRELVATRTDIVVVLAGGAPVEMPFVTDVRAIVHGHLGGQGGGRALTDILTGLYNPSGKLAVTYPLRYEDVPSAAYYPGQEATAEHREALYVGYRYYDTRHVPVLFPFGHGLSYTSFMYSDIEVVDTRVSCTVKNSGNLPGEEIVQVYVHPVAPVVFRPEKELKAFTKVALEPGQSMRVELKLDAHAFAYYNSIQKAWTTESGEYQVMIGSSSADIRLQQRVTKQGKQPLNPYDAKKIAAYYTADVQHVTDEEFASLYGRPLPVRKWTRTAPLELDDTIAQLQYKNILGKATYSIVMAARRFLLWIHRPLTANNILFVINMPFAKIEGFTGGKISTRIVKRFLRAINR